MGRLEKIVVLTVLFLVAVFHHAALGLQVVIEDYVHEEGPKLVVMLAAKFVLWLLAAVAVLAALRTAFLG